jgi:hypothetical protein
LLILTGTTGLLDSSLLTTMDELPESRISKIYYLNPSANSKESQKASKSRGLSTSWPESCVEFLRVELSLSWLGLSPEAYQQLLDETTQTIHCAWKVDLNITIEPFLSHRFVACGTFLSSVSARGAKLPWCSCRVSRRLLGGWHSRRTLQIAGPLSKRGHWNKQEWFPWIIASSKHVKILPETLVSFDTIDWVLVDLLSTIMVGLVGKLVEKEN